MYIKLSIVFGSASSVCLSVCLFVCVCGHIGIAQKAEIGIHQ